MLTRSRQRPGGFRPRAGGTTASLLMLSALLVPAVQALPGTPEARADAPPMAKRLGSDFRTAWRTTRGKGVTVAIVGTGVDRKVKTLAGAVKKGRDFVGTKNPRMVSSTLVTSLIAGSGPTAGSPFGIRGLAPAVDILPVRVAMDRDEPGARKFYRRGDVGKKVEKGIRWAADQHADVIVVLMDWYDSVNSIEGAVLYAQSKNAVVVAGNYRAESSEYPTYPAAAPGAIGSVPVDLRGRRLKKWSQADSSVFVAAPGSKIPTTGPGDSPWFIWGGAPAQAWVAAAVALVRAEYPDLPPALVAQAIARSAHHPKGGYNTDVGFGIVNPAGALKEARDLQKATLAAPRAQGAGAVAGRTRFDGPVPGPIDAVRPGTAKLAGFGGLTAAGVAALLAALIIALRSRRRGSPGSGRRGDVAPVDTESGDAAKS